MMVVAEQHLNCMIKSASMKYGTMRCVRVGVRSKMNAKLDHAGRFNNN